MIGAPPKAAEKASVSMVAEVMTSFSSGAPAQQPLEIAEQEIDIQRALVRFIQDEAGVRAQQRIGLHLGEEDAVRHEFDARLARRCRR